MISSSLADFPFRRNSSGVWMRELWQTTPHLWSLDSFSALNFQFWHHHHPQPWSTAKVLSRSVTLANWMIFADCFFELLRLVLVDYLVASPAVGAFTRWTILQKFGCLLVITLNVNGIQTFLNQYGCLRCFYCLFHHYFIYRCPCFRFSWSIYHCICAVTVSAPAPPETCESFQLFVSIAK